MSRTRLYRRALLAEKKEKWYKNSHIELTKELLVYNDWKIQQMDERAGKLAGMAIKLWPR